MLVPVATEGRDGSARPLGKLLFAFPRQRVSNLVKLLERRFPLQDLLPAHLAQTPDTGPGSPHSS